MSFTSQELRKKYIEFFTARSHVEVVSASTIPDEEDQTVLFTTAGMQQFTPNLMGKPHEKGRRLCSVQKCVRTVDIDEVGDNRHLTFFEMLGNWSLGDYFKTESIEWSYDFLINELKIDTNKLWVTVYGGDENLEYDQESHDRWIKMGVPEHKIVGIGAPTDPEKRRKKGRGDNFWAAGSTGPCGPSTELFIWLGEGEPAEGQNPATDEDNFIEVWNNVFMSYEQKENSSLVPLSQKNVDTGMGLERLTMIIQGKTTVFETDVYDGIIAKLEEVSGKKYPPYSEDLDENNSITRAFRVIADHVRCSTHLIADGVAASNEGRGYVLRRLLRRAVRFGKNLGITNFLEKIAEVYIAEYSKFYPEISERKQVIFSALQIEEENFLRTLEKGEKKLEEILDLKNSEKSHISEEFSGKDAFLLSDTYGFPRDLTRELVEEKGFTINEEVFNAEFDAELKIQKERSRASGKFEMKGEDTSAFDNLPATEFVGDTGKNLTEVEAKILAFVKIKQGEIKFSTDKTPCYAESGGQVGDRGELNIAGNIFRIIDTKKLKSGVVVHSAQIQKNVSCFGGPEKAIGMTVKISVDRNLRNRTTRHHSAAHLLQSALNEVLGEHITQAGSLVDENRTRFDFTHPKALSASEISQVETKISEYVAGSFPVVVKEMNIEEAKELGVVALFSEKYGKIVRTVRMGASTGLEVVSFELCGGTHIQNTSEIGGVKIISESSVASGVRRIEMVVAQAAQEFFLGRNTILTGISETLKTTPERLAERISKLTTDLKNSEKTVQELETQLVGFEAEEFLTRSVEISGKNIICEAVPTHDMKKVAGMAKSLSEKNIDIVALFTEDGGLAIATQKGGVSAREVFESIKDFAGGNGGGSPFFVQGKGIELENFQEIKRIVEGF